MKRIPLFTPVFVKITLSALCGVVGSSCSSTREVDYRNFERLPSKPSTAALRSVLKTVPYTNKRAFYGNYGGSGCLGGRPTDTMDEYFRRHDVVYTVARSKRTMKVADAELVKALRKIDDDSLSEYGREYRDRAIKFMESSFAGLIGKPLSASLRRSEPSGSYFSEPESVRRFFKLSHPGIPDVGEAGKRRFVWEGGSGMGEGGRMLAFKH